MHQRARPQIVEIERNGRRTDIDGGAVEHFPIRRPEINHVSIGRE